MNLIPNAIDQMSQITPGILTVISVAAFLFVIFSFDEYR